MIKLRDLLQELDWPSGDIRVAYFDRENRLSMATGTAQDLLLMLRDEILYQRLKRIASTDDITELWVEHEPATTLTDVLEAITTGDKGKEGNND